MEQLKKIIWNNRGWAALHCALGISIAFLENFNSSYFQKVIDSFTEKTLNGGMIILYGAALLSLYLCNYLSEYPGRKLEHGVYLDFKLEALEKISRMDYSAYQTLGTGKLIARIENGAQAGKNILVDFYLCLIRELLPTILFSMYFIWKLNPQIMGVILVGYAFVFLVSNLLLKRLYGIKERILTREEELQHYLVRGFQEMVVFRMYRRFGDELQRARQAKREIVDQKVKMTLVHEAFFTIFALLMGAVKIGLLVYAWRTRGISVGTVVALMSLVDNAYTPIAIFNVLYVSYKLDRSAYARLKAFFELPDETRLENGKSPEMSAGELRAEKLHFGYDEQEILKGIDLRIRAGEKVAFVGESGCGKSTLAKLLVGLLRTKEGLLTAGGTPLQEMHLEDFYSHVSYVPQEGSIFDGSLRENLCMGGARTDEELWEALRSVNLSDMVKKLPDGLDAHLGERGTALSGGEKQRLALARMLLDDTQLAVLDESTSAIDNINEEEILDRILKKTADRTLILIAHRLNAIAKFDRIVVFREGRLEADGTFEKLLEENAYFRELYFAGSE